MTVSEKIKSNRAHLTKATTLELERQLYSQSFYDFFVSAMTVLKPNVKWTFNFHHKFLCDLLQREAVRIHNKEPKSKDFIINIPPSTTKSSIISIAFPVWVWTLNPHLQFLCISNSDDLAIEFATASKDLIESTWFQELYPNIVLRIDSQSKSNYKNTLGGSRISQGIQTKVTGRHSDIILLDDPNDSKESLLQMATVFSSFEDAISSRGNDETSTFFIIMQRLAEADLTGSILASPMAGGYEHICLPVEHSDNIKPAYLGKYYRDNNLWPERFPLATKPTLGKSLLVFNTQYNQRPGNVQGDKIKREWFSDVIDIAPYTDYHLFVDGAYGKKGGDFTAIMVAGVKDNIMYVKEVYELSLEFPDLIREIKKIVERDTVANRARIYIEPKANGISVVQTLKRETMYNVMELKQPNDNKITKVDAITPKLESGRVKLVRGNWNSHFLDQCVLFPNGKNDDMVDTLQMAVSTLLNGSGRINWYVPR